MSYCLKPQIFYKSLFITLLLLNSCAQKRSTGTDSDLPESQVNYVKKVFSDSVTEFKVQVFYEQGAAPYVGNLSVLGPQTWNVTDESYKALFQGRAKSVNVPKQLSGMSAFAAQGQSSWTVNSLIALAESLPITADTASVASVSVIFIKGNFNGNTNVLGVQIGGYPYAFIFKDIVQSVGGTSTTQNYVEQAVVVHEIGHAIGAVNNGLPMAQAHEDSNHAHHTTNNRCVMYWAAETKSGVTSVVDNFVTLGSLNLFGSETLADAAAYQP